MKTFTFALSGLVLGLAGCATQPPVPPLNLEQTSTPVVARYTTTIHPGEEGDHHGDEDVAPVSNEWVFSRSAERVEVFLPQQATGEAWLKDGPAMFYEKIFHADRKVIEYQPEDLSALNVEANWETNRLMLAPGVLAQLPIDGGFWEQGHPVSVLKGSVNGVDYEVHWLVDLNIPQSLVSLNSSGRREVTQLEGVVPENQQAGIIPASQGYDVIEYADLGDRERDPFVMKVQHFLPGGHQHSH